MHAEPPRVRIESVIGDTILAVARDSLDVQRVQLLVIDD